jgi:hypothetical protein
MYAGHDCKNSKPVAIGTLSPIRFSQDTSQCAQKNPKAQLYDFFEYSQHCDSNTPFSSIETTVLIACAVSNVHGLCSSYWSIFQQIPEDVFSSQMIL